MEIDLHNLMVFVGLSLVVISFVAVHKLANKEIDDNTSKEEYCSSGYPCIGCPGYPNCYMEKVKEED